MTKNSNMTATVELGREAARFWGLSIKHGDSGDAHAIVALVHAERIMTFEATVERKKEDTKETFEFSIHDLAEPYWNNDGSKDTRKMAARTLALCERLFGITDCTNAVKTRLARCIKSALYLVNSLKDMSDEDLLDNVRIQHGRLVVPYGLVIDQPKEDASDKEKAIFDAMKEKPIQLDGKENASLAQLSRRASPPKDKRAAGEHKDKGASLVASVDFVQAVVAGWNNPDGETDNAPNKELESKLFALSQEIAAYFAEHPMSEEEKKPTKKAA